MTHTEEHDDVTTAIERALSEVSIRAHEPDPVTADAITEIDVHGTEATVVIDPGAYPDVSWDVIEASLRPATEAVVGIETADVVRATDDDRIAKNVEDFDRVIAVASAKGGVGKSTVAAHLATTLSADSDVGLFDADIHGPNVPRLFDVEGPVYSTDDGDPIPISYDGLDLMSVGLLESEVPLAWRGAMAHDAVSELFGDTAWSHDDTLVIDLPPGTGDVVLTTLEEVPVDGLVVVTTPFHTSVTDTNRTIDLFRDEGIPILGAVVNMAEFVCESCGEPNDLFEDGVADLATEVLLTLPFDQELQDRPVPGESPAGFDELAARIDAQLDALGSYTPPSDAVDIRGLPAETRRQRVREEFEAIDSGESFRLVSDRDPSPVREFLAGLADVSQSDLAPFDVERKTPDTWELETVRP